MTTAHIACAAFCPALANLTFLGFVEFAAIPLAAAAVGPTIAIEIYKLVRRALRG